MNIDWRNVAVSCVVALLCGCSSPKHYSLNELGGFNDSGCVFLKEGGKVWAKRYQRSRTDEQRVTFFQAGEPGGRGMREGDIPLSVGTRLLIKDVRTWWDFENGHRLFMTGMLVGDAKNQPFYFEEYMSSNDVTLVHKILAPCPAPHGL